MEKEIYRLFMYKINALNLDHQPLRYYLFASNIFFYPILSLFANDIALYNEHYIAPFE
jgi:hypothetical protein